MKWKNQRKKTQKCKNVKAEKATSLMRSLRLDYRKKNYLEAIMWR
jgi:hypothetical protein